MRVTPPSRRSSHRRTPEGLEISIPAKRNIFLLLFLAAWMVGWGFGEVFAARELLIERKGIPDLFLVAWLTGWTIGGGFVFYSCLWMLKGREIIVLRPDTLVIKRDLAGFGRAREYDLQHTRSLRVAPSSSWNPYDWSSSLQPWGIGGGLIAFDYGAQTVRFANSVDEAEAREIVRELKSQHAFPDMAA